MGKHVAFPPWSNLHLSVWKKPPYELISQEQKIVRQLRSFGFFQNISQSMYVIFLTNTKSLAKEFFKILIFEYFGRLKIGFDVFFDADSESPRMT